MKSFKALYIFAHDVPHELTHMRMRPAVLAVAVQSTCWRDSARDPFGESERGGYYVHMPELQGALSRCALSRCQSRGGAENPVFRGIRHPVAEKD
jgi:hypothetical protein